MASIPSRSVHLANLISENTTKIEAYRQEQSLPLMSLGPEAPLDVKYPPHIEQSRQALVNASLELSDLATGPVELRLVPGWAGMTMFAVTQFIFDFGISQQVPPAGDISYQDLAKAVNVGAGVLRQVLRAGMAH